MNNHQCPCCGSHIHAVYPRHYSNPGYQQPYQPYAPVNNYGQTHYYTPRQFQYLITPTELSQLVGKQIRTTIQGIGQVTACVASYDATSNRVTLSNITHIQTGESYGTQAYLPSELVGYNKISDTCPGAGPGTGTTGTGTTGTGAGTGVDAPTSVFTEEQLAEKSVLKKTIGSFDNIFTGRRYRVYLEVTVPTIIAQQSQGILDRCMETAKNAVYAVLVPFLTPATVGGLAAAIPGAIATGFRSFSTCVAANPIIYPYLNKITLDIKAGYERFSM